MKHVLSAVGVAAATLLLCTACVGSSSGSGGTSTASASGAAASGTAASGSGGGTGGGATATSTGTGAGSGGNGGSTGSGSGSGSGGSSGTSACLTRYLNGSVSGGQGAAGSTYVNLVFKNLNNKPCTMYGYPGVSFGAGTPVQQVGQPADRNPQVSPKLVTLQPGGYAYAVLQIGDADNYPASTCQPTATTYLQVYPPNTSNLLYVAFTSTGCKGNVVTLHVQAVQPGTGS